MPTVIPMFQPRGESIMELLMRQGDVAGRAALMRGEAISRGIEGVGNAVAQGVMAYGQKKSDDKIRMQLDAAMASFDPANPMDFYRRTAVAVGPEAAMRVTSGMASLMKLQQSQQPDMKDAATLVGGLAALEEKAPGWIAKNWNTTGPSLEPVAKLFGVPLNPETIGETVLSLNAGLNEKKDEGGFTLGPGQVRYNAAGEQLAAGPPKEEEAFNLSPGQVRYGAGGQVIAVGPPKEKDPTAAAMAQARLDAIEEKKREREAEIGAYVDALGAGDYTIDKVPPTIQRQVMVEAQKRGLDVRTSKQKDLDSSAEQTIESLAQLREQAQRTMTATTGPGAVVQGKLQGALNYVGLADETRKWEKQAAKLSLLARQLGEKGVLTDRDVERVVNMLPGLTDKASIRDKALQDIEDIIFAGLRGRVSSRVKLPDAKAGAGDGTLYFDAQGNPVRR